MKLIAGFYRNYSGKLVLNGDEIGRLGSDTVFSKIAYIPQEPFIFEDSIKNNICFGCNSNDAS